MNGLRTLLGEVVDYAGLFPPASLDMAAAVRNYASYKKSTDEWMLGNFIVPVSRLDEFLSAAQGSSLHRAPWHLSVLVGDLEKENAVIRDFVSRNDPATFRISSLETKAASNAEIERIARYQFGEIVVYVEIPIQTDPRNLLSDLASAGMHAKVRTGGITPDMFPATADLARFIIACVKAGVPFKATAGLHHPIRSTYRLTYAPDSPSGMMFGFLNVFLAGAFARKGMDSNMLMEVLEEGRGDAFRFDDGGARWREHQLTMNDLTITRQVAVMSFGSCSFREPVDELTALGLPGDL